MIGKQENVNIEVTALVNKAKQLHEAGYRLVQIGCTALDTGYEINYSFDKDYNFLNLRLSVASGDSKVPSMSGVYWNAFLYENEIHDLFGIQVKDMSIDYKGNFYRTAVKTPFARNPKKESST